MEIQLFAHPKFASQSIAFEQKYELIDIFFQGDGRFAKRTMKPFSERKCRFCNKCIPEMSFSDLAHLLPQLIGNTNLYSDYECNNCNKRFSKCEGDFANFLGISRSMTGLQGEKMTVGFVGKKLKAKSRSFVGDNILILAPEDFLGDNTTGVGTIKYVKNNFVPSQVYKALLKSAISLLDENEVSKYYSASLDYLNDNILLDSGAFIAGFHLPFSYNLPLYTFLFKKRNANENIPTHMFVFNFQNIIISFPLLFHKSDCQSSRFEFQIPLPPPFFINKIAMVNANPQAFTRDLSSNSLVDNEEESITFNFDLNSNKKSAVYDPETGQTTIREHNPIGLKYLIISKDWVTVDPKELSTFIREHMEKSP